MEDGRFVSNNFPNGMFESLFQKKMNIKTNEDYRHYLTHNANHIMKENLTSFSQNNIHHSFLDLPDKKHGPFLFDIAKPTTIPAGYELNSVKTLYLSRQELAAQQTKRYKNINV